MLVNMQRLANDNYSSRNKVKLPELRSVEKWNYLINELFSWKSIFSRQKRNNFVNSQHLLHCLSMFRWKHKGISSFNNFLKVNAEYWHCSVCTILFILKFNSLWNQNHIDSFESLLNISSQVYKQGKWSTQSLTFEQQINAEETEINKNKQRDERKRRVHLIPCSMHVASVAQLLQNYLFGKHDTQSIHSFSCSLNTVCCAFSILMHTI